MSRHPAAPGHGDEALGPSDSADSGSDRTGLDTSDPGRADAHGGLPEDEAADPVGDGQADAAFAASMPPRPGQPNPAPDPPDGTSPLLPDGDLPVPDDDEPHAPGREPALRRR